MDIRIKNIEITKITTDDEIQQRVEMADWKIREYYESMKRGDSFPAIVVFFDGETYWLADGFHRVAAARKIEKLTFEAEIKNGSKRDAIFYALASNKSHGLNRNRKDIKKAILTILSDAEWSQMSNVAIANHIGCSEGTVRYWKRKMMTETIEIERPKNYDGPPSEFFGKMFGLYKEREGKPLTDWGNGNGFPELAAVIKSHTNGVRVRGGKDERGMDCFTVDFVRYDFDDKQKKSWHEPLLKISWNKQHGYEVEFIQPTRIQSILPEQDGSTSTTTPQQTNETYTCNEDVEAELREMLRQAEEKESAGTKN